MEALETILVIFLIIYVLALTINEVGYMIRGYRIIRYVPKRKTEVIFPNPRRVK